MRIQIKYKRILSMAAGIILSVAVLTFGLIFANERPGGFIDWRMSHAIGVSGTMHIPIGKTPEEAIEQFRQSSTMQVIYKEPVKGGMLVFMERPDPRDSTNLQIEYIRKTWLGWKWVWGGGYSISLHEKNAVNYMSMPELAHITTPFPAVFGEVMDPSIKNVTIEIKGKGKYIAKLVKVGPEKIIWFAILPSSGSSPFDIKAFNEQGDLSAMKTINDPRDSGSIDLLKASASTKGE